MPKTVLSVLAHPDDAEFVCAGTMARLVRERGWEAHIATMTPGDCGSAEMFAEEIARVRRAEGGKGAAVIGAAYHCMEERDLRVFYNAESLAKATRLLRKVRPNLVFTHSPADYMLDHELTSVIARAACFAAPAPNYLADEGVAPLERIPHLYYCDPPEGKDQFGNAVTPGFCIDISRVIEIKTEMLAAHESQRNWLLKHHGIDHYLNAMKDWSAKRGELLGVKFAEGFRQHLGHGYPQDNVLQQILDKLT